MNTQHLFAASLLAIAACTGSAATLDFEDLSGDPTIALASGYGGFDWQTMASITAAPWPDSGYAQSVVSGANAVYSWDGAPVAIRWLGAGTIDFGSAYFTSAWQEQELVIEGWRGSQLRYSTPESLVITTDAALKVQLDWAGIDRLMIYNSANHWAMDDFSFTASAVPEPGRAGLLVLGLAALGLACKRRQWRA